MRVQGRPNALFIAARVLGLLFVSTLVAGGAGARGKGAPYPSAWAVSASAATESEAVGTLVAGALPGYEVVGVAWSADWSQIRHRESGRVTGRRAQALVVLREAAADRCLLVEPIVRQDRSAGADGWDGTRLAGDNLQRRTPEEVPTVRRIGPDKTWWSITLDGCPVGG